MPLARDLAARAAGGPPEAGGRRRAPSSSTCARPTACAARTSCTASTALGVAVGHARGGPGLERARSARRGGWRGSPSCRCALVELAGHGTTVEAAATSRLVEQVAQADPARRRRRRASSWPCSPTCPTRCAPAVRVLGELAARAPDVGELMDAARPAGRRRCATATCARTDAAALRGRVRRAGGARRRRARRAPPRRSTTTPRRAMVERLSARQAALAVVDHPARHARAARRCSSSSPTAGASHGLVQGRATRLLHDGGHGRRPTVEAPARSGAHAGHPGGRRARRSSRGSSPAAAPCCCTTRSCWPPSTAWIASLRRRRVRRPSCALLRRTFGAFEPAERRQLGALLATGRVERAAPMGDDVDDGRGPPPAWRRCGRCSAWPPRGGRRDATPPVLASTSGCGAGGSCSAAATADGTGVDLRGDDQPHRRRPRRAVRPPAPRGRGSGRRRRAGPLGAVGRPLARRHPPLLPDARRAGAAARRRRAARPAPAAARAGAARRAGARPAPRHAARRAQPGAARRDPGDGPPGDRHGARPSSRRASPTAPARRCAARSPGPAAPAGPARPTSTGRARSTPTCATGCPSTARWCPSASSASAATSAASPATSSSPSTRAARWPTASSTPRCSPACSPGCRRCARRWSRSTPPSPT